MRAPLRLALALAALLVPAACDSPLEPGEVPGTYVLTSVNGTPLPAVTFDTPHARQERISDVLQLGADGRGKQVVELRTTQPGATIPVTREVVTWELGFGVREGRVEVTYFCPPNALCVEGPHLTGRRDGATLILTEAADAGGNRFIYRRIAP